MELDPETGLAISAQGKYGCTDAINYDFSAQIDDHSCGYKSTAVTVMPEHMIGTRNDGPTIRIHLSPMSKYDIVLYDVLEKRIQKYRITDNKLFLVPGLQSGIYFGKIKSGKVSC